MAELFLPAGIAESLGPLQSFQGLAEVAHKGLQGAKQAISDDPAGRVVHPVGDFNNFMRLASAASICAAYSRSRKGR